MTIRTVVFLAATGAVATLAGFQPTPAHAAGCFHEWAKPGTYAISGDFRGQVEAAGAQLTNDCRVYLKVPGVFSGGKVKKAGRCLRFSFKVEKSNKVFRAQWCGDSGVVPWDGRNVRVSVRRVGIR